MSCFICPNPAVRDSCTDLCWFCDDDAPDADTYTAEDAYYDAAERAGDAQRDGER